MEEQLAAQYQRRFEAEEAVRDQVWRTLIDSWFCRYLDDAEAVFDLGCGWGQFINQVDAPRRFALDLNPDAIAHLDTEVEFFAQPADEPWPVEDASLDLVFTSNFLEHLPSREAVSTTLAEAHRRLRPGGRFVAIGPNIKYAGGRYWDFFDHLVPLTELSMLEAAELVGFEADEVIGRFLPYTMAGRRPPPAALIRAYLRLRPAWRLLGKQFLVVCHRPR